jgi:hypothetical protein
MVKQKSVLIFGAGSTVSLGMPSTKDQDLIFRTFFFEDDLDKLEKHHLKSEDILRLKKIKLTKDFDIGGVIQFTRYFFREENFRMFDLYNLLDMQIVKNQNLIMNGTEETTLYPYNFVKYREGILILLQEYFSIKVSEAQRCDEFKKHINFFEKMGKKLIKTKSAEALLKGDLRDTSFIFADFSYISFNWDVLFLWSMFIAHKNINDQNASYLVKDDQVFKLKVFNDFATFMTCKRIDTSNRKWYPYNESIAFRVNDREHNADRRVTLIPTYFPHGQTNWLHCPYCGMLSAYLGNCFELNSETLVMNSPIESEGQYECVQCGKSLSTKNSAMLLQTLYKIKTPYIEEIQRAMRIKVTEANNLIFIGYSLPDDDIEYKAFFRTAKTDKTKKVFVVLYDADQNKQKWFKASEISGKVSNDNEQVIARYCEIFGKENVFVSLAGFPKAAKLIMDIV